MTHPIRTDADRTAALARIEVLWDAKPGMSEDHEFEVLTTLVAAYEAEHWPILPPDPVEAIEFHMEQNGLHQNDLAAVLGSESRASRVLNRRRTLSIETIGQIHAAWGIPLACLLAAPTDPSP